MLFQEIPLDASTLSCVLIVVEGKGVEGAPFNPLWNGIQTVSHDLPRLLLENSNIFLTVSAIISRQR